MSIVAVHGPNTMFTTQGGGQSIPSSGGGVAQATKDPTNGLKFSFSVPKPGARPAADFDWTFTGPGSPAAQPDKINGTVTFTGPGAVTIVCTVAAGAGPPAAGTYTTSATATAGTPRMVEESAPEQQGASVQQSGDEEQPTEAVPVGYDPAAHTVDDVKEFVTEHPEEARAIYDTEVAGKNRATLITWLEENIPFDPGEYTIDEVKAYVEANPDVVDDILAAEETGKARVTLITWLEDFQP